MICPDDEDLHNMEILHSRKYSPAEKREAYRKLKLSQYWCWDINEPRRCIVQDPFPGADYDTVLKFVQEH